MRKLAEIWSFVCRHKYLVACAVFILIIGFLDENSLVKRIAHRREIHRLNTEIEHYRRQYEEDSRSRKELTGNKEALEKVAREKYLMKQKNEDIFVFESEMEEE